MAVLSLVFSAMIATQEVGTNPATQCLGYGVRGWFIAKCPQWQCPPLPAVTQALQSFCVPKRRGSPLVWRSYNACHKVSFRRGERVWKCPKKGNNQKRREDGCSVTFSQRPVSSIFFFLPVFSKGLFWLMTMRNSLINWFCESPFLSLEKTLTLWDFREFSEAEDNN